MSLDPRYRFEKYVVGAGNRLAVAAARAVAQAPGAHYNPLFLYGGSGTGKTHLMIASGHLAVERRPGLHVLQVTMDALVEQFHAALTSGELGGFKSRYAGLGMLLLDDVQFLADRREVQTEMLRLFDAMHRDGCQIVLTSDRPPSDMADLDQRLITRFSGGLIVDIGAPDYETRLGILRSICGDRSVSFTTGVLEEMARIAYGNVRELQGALNRLVALHTLEHVPVTPETVHPLLLGDRPPVTQPAAPLQPREQEQDAGEFSIFLDGLRAAVARHLEAWQMEVRDAADQWQARGYATGMLERAIEGRETPDVDALLSRYEAGVHRLQELARTAADIDPDAAESHVFLDPERIDEAEHEVERMLRRAYPLPAPSVQLTRDAFEVGLSNQLAVYAANAVVEQPGVRYNPLFVHGGSGVGKTHLVNAIGNDLLSAADEESAVAYVTARQFIDEIVEALQEGTIERWRARYRAVDALILDDVHELRGTGQAQEELFHVFNALHQRGKQIVLASDLAPRALDTLEDRLRSRFEGGLVVELKEPDRLLREKLFARALEREGLPLDARLLDYLADRPVGNAREIDHVVHRLARAAEVSGVPLSAALARHELEGSVAIPAHAGANGEQEEILLDREKVVWDWPDLAGRAIEEWR